MRSKSIRKTRVNKKKYNRKKTIKKREMIAKVIPIPHTNNTIIMFNKYVPKNVINKVLNKINSSNGKRTRKNKRKKIYRGGIHKSALATSITKSIATAAESNGPMGWMANFASGVYRYGGGMVGTLVLGATLATILGSLKTMNISSPDREIDLVEQKKMDDKLCKGGILSSEGECKDKIIGTTPARHLERLTRDQDKEDDRKEALERAKASGLMGIPHLLPGTSVPGTSVTDTSVTDTPAPNRV